MVLVNTVARGPLSASVDFPIPAPHPLGGGRELPSLCDVVSGPRGQPAPGGDACPDLMASAPASLRAMGAVRVPPDRGAGQPGSGARKTVSPVEAIETASGLRRGFRR